MDASQLRLEPEEISRLLKVEGCSDELVHRVASVSEGWPIAVQLMGRLAREDRLTAALESFTDNALDSLLDYLSREYFSSLPIAARNGALLASAIADITLVEIQEWAALPLAETQAFVWESPFLQQHHDGTIKTHPLMKALASSRYEPESRTLVENSIDCCETKGQYLRAAELAFRLNQAERSARLLSLEPAATDQRTKLRIFELINCLDSSSIAEHSSLWLAACDFRRFAVPLTQLADEARSVYHTLPHDVPERHRKEVAVQYAWILLHSGNPRKAIDVIDDAYIATEDLTLQTELSVVRASLFSTLGNYLEARRAARQVALESTNPVLHAQLMDFVEATSALRSGEYDRGIALLEQASKLARKRGLVSLVLISLSNLAFEAWLAGDEERLAQAVAEIRASMLPGFERGWAFWLDAVSGHGHLEPSGYEPVSMRAIGYLFLACRPGAFCLSFMRRAVILADEAGDIGLKAIVTVAAAELDQRSRTNHLSNLNDLRSCIDIDAFRDALTAYTTGSGDLGFLRHLIQERLQNETSPPVAMTLDLIAGQLIKSGVDINLSSRELAVLTYLACSGRSRHRDAITAAIWPDLDADSATNNLRVLTHKLRKRLGETILVNSPGGYALGPRVACDINEMEGFVRQMQDVRSLTTQQRESLQSLIDRNSARRPEPMLRYEWYVALDHRLNELARQAALCLGYDDLSLGNHARAMTLAEYLLYQDQTDEAAFELGARALLSEGNYVELRRSLRAFEEAARREGDELAVRRSRGLVDRLLREIGPGEILSQS